LPCHVGDGPTFGRDQASDECFSIEAGDQASELNVCHIVLLLISSVEGGNPLIAASLTRSLLRVVHGKNLPLKSFCRRKVDSVVDFLLLGFYRQHGAFKLFKLTQKIQHLLRRNLPDEFA
jgi:hypothetical protein